MVRTSDFSVGAYPHTPGHLTDKEYYLLSDSRCNNIMSFLILGDKLKQYAFEFSCPSASTPYSRSAFYMGNQCSC